MSSKRIARLYHSTTEEAAASILREGFRDGTGSYGCVGITLTGVFVSDLPVDENEGAKGYAVLETNVPEGFDLDGFGIVEEGRPPWEWLIPAAVLNRWPVRLLSEDELYEVPTSVAERSGT
jgi:hypothetical protein